MSGIPESFQTFTLQGKVLDEYAWTLSRYLDDASDSNEPIVVSAHDAYAKYLQLNKDTVDNHRRFLKWKELKGRLHIEPPPCLVKKRALKLRVHIFAFDAWSG
jgi:hypothetical protein